MASKKKVVVAGYGAWAMTSTNPAALTIAQLAGETWPNCDLVSLEVPVRTQGLWPLIEETLVRERPDIWLGVGVAPRIMSIRMEAVGVNCRDFEVADNDGVKLEGAPVLDGGPAAYFSTLPSRAVVAAMREAGIPAELSYSAGTHLCNQMLYTTLHLIAQKGLSTQSGFLHVPYTPEFVAERQAEDGLQPSLPVSVMAQAARVCIDLSLERLQSRGERKTA
ncbi:MAG: pyroglutamyl-peptidase I [Rhodospirillales bacterium]